MPLASLEEMESNDTIVSVDGNRVFDLVREGKIYVSIVQTYVLCLNNVYLHVLFRYIKFIYSTIVCICVDLMRTACWNMMSYLQDMYFMWFHMYTMMKMLNII